MSVRAKTTSISTSVASILLLRQQPLRGLGPGGRPPVQSPSVGWIYALLLAGAVIVLAAAEWPRLSARFGLERPLPRARRRRRAHLHLVQTESEEFAASVERDLQRLPTIDERDPR